MEKFLEEVIFRLRLEGSVHVGQENGSEGGGKGREMVVSGDKSGWGESWKRETVGRVREGQETEKGSMRIKRGKGLIIEDLIRPLKSGL